MIDTWDSCYNLSWKGIITAESFSHPAKFSHALIRRIYQHIIAEGWVKQGDMILDCFGGVGLGGLYAAQSGLQWVGCELERKFVDLGQQNIALWESKFAPGFPRWVKPVLLQGDSRRLSEIIGQVTAVMKSPPYIDTPIVHQADGDIGGNYRKGNRQPGAAKGKDINYGSSPGRLGQMSPGDISAIISSPPFAGNSGGRGEASRNGIDAALFERHSGGMKKGTGESEGNLDNLPMGSIGAVISSPPFSPNGNNPAGRHQSVRADYGQYANNPEETGFDTEGQLGSMPSGNIQAIISSPPFADSVGSDDPDKRGGLYRDPKRRNDVNLSGTYGETEGQLGAMRDVRAVMKSPPFENQIPQQDKTFVMPHDTNGNVKTDYGQSPNQLGNESGETFWQAAAAIVSQCAMVLPSGGHCVWVVKNYIKQGREVDFTGQWIQLCEAYGFELIHIHRAWLVKNRGTIQTAMIGEDVSKETARKSFFRLLAERKGLPKIDWETVLCFVRT